MKLLFTSREMATCQRGNKSLLKFVAINENSPLTLRIESAGWIFSIYGRQPRTFGRKGLESNPVHFLGDFIACYFIFSGGMATIY